MGKLFWIYIIGLIVGLILFEIEVRMPDGLSSNEEKASKKQKKPKDKKLNLKECMICHQVRDGVECMGNHICRECIEKNQI